MLGKSRSNSCCMCLFHDAVVSAGLIKPELGFICLQLEHITSEQSNVPPVASPSSLSFTAITVPGSHPAHSCLLLPSFLTHTVTSSFTTWLAAVSRPVSFSLLSLCFSLSFPFGRPVSSPGRGAFAPHYN